MSQHTRGKDTCFPLITVSPLSAVLQPNSFLNFTETRNTISGLLFRNKASISDIPGTERKGSPMEDTEESQTDLEHRFAAISWQETVRRCPRANFYNTLVCIHTVHIECEAAREQEQFGGSCTQTHTSEKAAAELIPQVRLECKDPQPWGQNTGQRLSHSTHMD